MCASYSENVGQTVCGFAFYLYFIGYFHRFGSSVIGIFSSISLPMFIVGVSMMWIGVKWVEFAFAINALMVWRLKMFSLWCIGRFG